MRTQLILTFLSLIILAACSGPQPAAPTTAPTAAPTTAPEVEPTSIPPTQPPPTAVPPTNTPASWATQLAPTKTPPAPTPTSTATAAPTATRPRPAPTSSGPLGAAIYVANCRNAPTTDKPGRVLVQISVEASGGNGRYRYFYQDQESPTKFIDVIGEKGTRLIGEVKVTSGDGQEIKKEFDFGIGDLTCS